MNKTRLFVILFVGLVFVLSGCCATTGNVSPSNQQTSPTTPSSGNAQTNPATNTETQASNIDNGQIGTPYTINYAGSQYEVTLLNAEFAQPTSSYFTGHYLMANFEIKNVGSTNQIITPDIYALDSSSEKYDNTFAIGVDDKYSKTLSFLAKLGPGTKTTGWTAIEVPENTSSLDLYFEYSNYWSNTPNYIKWKITKN